MSTETDQDIDEARRYERLSLKDKFKYHLKKVSNAEVLNNKTRIKMWKELNNLVNLLIEDHGFIYDGENPTSCVLALKTHNHTIQISITPDNRYRVSSRGSNNEPLIFAEKQLIEYFLQEIEKNRLSDKKSKIDDSIIENKINSIITKVGWAIDDENNPLEIKKVSTLESLGLDSLDAIEIIMRIEDEFDIEIDDSEIYNFKTVSELYSLVESKI